MTTKQSGIQWRTLDRRDERNSTNGLLFRGVVIATYVTDDPDYPEPEVTDANIKPVAVYCDVLCYTSMPGTHWIPIPKAMVLQDKGSMHNGRIWKPKATTMDITQNTYNPDGGGNPANYDGDHVLVGFLDGNKNQPIILGGVPHPSHDIGNEPLSSGHRLQLKLADGDPDFFKHHGTFYGVDDNGDWIVDTTFANKGNLDPTGNEEYPPTAAGQGSQTAYLPMNATQRIEFFDMAEPDAPVSKSYQELTKDIFDIALNNGMTLQAYGKDDNARLVVGDGAKHVPITEEVTDWWTNFVKIYLDTHVHGPPGSPPVTPCPPWSATNDSTKVSIPNG